MKLNLYIKRYKYPPDLTGLIFNKWTVLEDAGKNKFGRSSWKCRCICGNESIVSRKALTMGTSRACIKKCASISLKERLMKKTEKNEDCWNFTGSKDELGYGRIHQKEFKKEIKYIGAHRASWLVNKGEIPEGLFVCHICDNPSCINPDHLFLGTNKENMQDKMKKGRHRSTKGKTWKIKKREKKNV